MIGSEHLVSPLSSSSSRENSLCGPKDSRILEEGVEVFFPTKRSGGKNLLESFDAEHDNTLSKKDLGEAIELEKIRLTVPFVDYSETTLNNNVLAAEVVGGNMKFSKLKPSQVSKRFFLTILS
ncbi:hypothetical protein ACET3Z_031068 [Daucus carota]